VCSASRPDQFTPGKDPVPIVQEAGWAPGLVWACAKNLTPPPGFDPRTCTSTYLRKIEVHLRTGHEGPEE
jgi:hypothetical protein